MTDAEWDALRSRAAAMATDDYTTAASDLIRLTRDEVREILETAAVDQQQLAELMQIVKSSTLSNEQKAEALRTTAGLAELAVALVAKLA